LHQQELEQVASTRADGLEHPVVAGAIDDRRIERHGDDRAADEGGHDGAHSEDEPHRVSSQKIADLGVVQIAAREHGDVGDAGRQAALHVVDRRPGLQADGDEGDAVLREIGHPAGVVDVRVEIIVGTVRVHSVEEAGDDAGVATDLDAIARHRGSEGRAVVSVHEHAATGAKIGSRRPRQKGTRQTGVARRLDAEHLHELAHAVGPGDAADSLHDGRRPRDPGRPGGGLHATGRDGVGRVGALGRGRGDPHVDVGRVGEGRDAAEDANQQRDLLQHEKHRHDDADERADALERRIDQHSKRETVESHGALTPCPGRLPSTAPRTATARGAP
jgi:hypothetical protein